MKTLIVSAILFLSTFTGDKWKLLTDNTNKFTIEHPADWKVSMLGDIEYLVTPLTDEKDLLAENLGIASVHNEFGKADLVATAAAVKKHYKAIIKDYEYIQSGEVDINGRKMFKINYNTSYDTIKMNITQYYYLTKTTTFILTATMPAVNGDPKFLSISEKVVATFKEL